MKKNILFFFFICTVCMVACINEDIQFEKGNISRDVAYKLMLKDLNFSLKEVDIWATEDKLPGNIADVCSGKGTVSSPDSESWFFFIDESPMGNWGHSCQYLFVDMNGDIYVYQQTMPPTLLDDMILLNISEARKNDNSYFIVPQK